MFYIFTCKWYPQHHLFENGVFYSCIALPFLINQVTGFVGLSTCCILGLGESLLRALMFPRSGPIGMPDRSAFAETSLLFLSSFHLVFKWHTLLVGNAGNSEKVTSWLEGTDWWYCGAFILVSWWVSTSSWGIHKCILLVIKQYCKLSYVVCTLTSQCVPLGCH